MKVCAHINLGPFNNVYQRFSSMKEAKEYFVNRIAGTDYGTGTDFQCMDLYPRCDSCSSAACFHDYPLARYEVDGTVVRRTA